MAKKQEGSISLTRTGGVLPDGVYKVKVDHMELKSGQKGPYFACRFKVDRRDSIVFENISQSDGARFRMEAFLDAIEAPNSGAMPPAKFIVWCRGKSLYVTLTNQSYEGRLKNVIGSYLLPDVALQMLAEQAAATDGHEPDEEDYDEEDSEDEDEDDEDSDDEEDAAWPDGTATKDALPF